MFGTRENPWRPDADKMVELEMEARQLEIERERDEEIALDLYVEERRG